MAQPKTSTKTDAPAGGDASATSQQELYGRREPNDLDERRVDDDSDDASTANPGRGTDATGHPSTARAGANTQ
jgi:hypothetical protein